MTTHSRIRTLDQPHFLTRITRRTASNHLRDLNQSLHTYPLRGHSLQVSKNASGDCATAGFLEKQNTDDFGVGQGNTGFAGGSLYAGNDLKENVL